MVNIRFSTFTNTDTSIYPVKFKVYCLIYSLQNSKSLEDC